MKHKLCLLTIIPTFLLSLSTLVAAAPSPNPARHTPAAIPANGGNAGLIMGNGGKGSDGTNQTDQAVQNGGNGGLIIGNGGNGSNGTNQTDQAVQNDQSQNQALTPQVTNSANTVTQDQ